MKIQLISPVKLQETITLSMTLSSVYFFLMVALRFASFGAAISACLSASSSTAITLVNYYTMATTGLASVTYILQRYAPRKRMELDVCLFFGAYILVVNLAACFITLPVGCTSFAYIHYYYSISLVRVLLCAYVMSSVAGGVIKRWYPELIPA